MGYDADDIDAYRVLSTLTALSVNGRRKLSIRSVGTITASLLSVSLAIPTSPSAAVSTALGSSTVASKLSAPAGLTASSYSQQERRLSSHARTEIETTRTNSSEHLAVDSLSLGAAVALASSSSAQGLAESNGTTLTLVLGVPASFSSESASGGAVSGISTAEGVAPGAYG